MRIVSLLPGATETLFALGLGGSVVGATHECDHPAAARALPRVTRPTLDLDGLDGGEIEASVAAAAASGRPLYEVDLARIKELAPDLVVAQDVCRVCAVPAQQLLGQLDQVRVVRQHPHSLEQVLEETTELAAALHEIGAATLAVGPGAAGLTATVALETPAIDERLAPLVNVVELQWLALELSRRLGVDADSFRKVGRYAAAQSKFTL